MLEGIIGVIEVAESPHPNHLSNIALTFGQLVVGTPVTLYTRGRHKDATPAGDWEISGWTGRVLHWKGLLEVGVQRLLPHSVTESLTAPTASTYVFACLAFGTMVVWQYHHNRKNTFQGPLLVIGVGLGFVLSALASQETDIQVNTILPATIVAGLMMGQLLATICGYLKPNGAHITDPSLKQALEGWMTGPSEEKQAIKFLTLH